jgi:hypothetical protein
MDSQTRATRSLGDHVSRSLPVVVFAFVASILAGHVLLIVVTGVLGLVLLWIVREFRQDEASAREP